MASMRGAKQAAREVAGHPWAEPLMRGGFIAKGTVYAIIGVLAAMAAAGAGGETTDQQGAIRRIADLPFGRLLLGLLALGLLGYALWRLSEAIINPEGETGGKGAVKRTSYVISALIYGGLAALAIRISFGSGDSGGGTQDLTARVMAAPFGRVLVGLAGVAILGAGLYQFYEAYSAKFREKFKLGQMTPTEERWTVRAGRWGLASRGVVFVIIGLLVGQAALRADPSRAQGLDGALQTLAQQPFGQVLLGVVALGLVAYAAYMFVCARYQRI